MHNFSLVISLLQFLMTAVRLRIRLEISIETETSVASLITSLFNKSTLSVGGVTKFFFKALSHCPLHFAERELVVADCPHPIHI